MGAGQALGMLGFPSRVKAVLGPTNTGKTHLAIERMLGHSSGIIGFPLRLLARENYDRMVAQKGVRSVALITGEEKIVPAGARWFSCTAEAMPLDRPVEFVAVDEIQLCADPDRGHVFTERLLHARGLVETMFLGAETIRPLLQRLVPQAEVETRPRLSHLTFAGAAKLMRLPPRSAVVAFSAGEVYAIAEAIRRRRGGCAVVMGRLSPRTRNAQVKLYQDKEVDFLVATDAIGMGLNMDVDHVAFANTAKFDGRRPRLLTAAEVAQIAGRAGRGMRDGTFGTTERCPALDDEMVRAVEAHSFEALEQVYWRNAELDFSSVAGLLESLQAGPPRVGLVRGPDATDLETLGALGREEEVLGLARGRRAVRLLWEVCGIPDFRKLADDTHTRLCARVFTHLMRDGRVPGEWMETGIAGLARTEGDIDTLMQRLSGVRVYAYIAARTDWVADAAGWQARMRAVEDLVSDALHEKLTARFVDRRAAHLMRRLDDTAGEALLSAVTQRDEVVVEGHAVGHVEGFQFVPDPLAEGPEKRMVLRAARRALRAWIPGRVAALEGAGDEAFSWGVDHRLRWGAAVVGRLRAGVAFLRPVVEVTDSEYLDGAGRERVRVRLDAYVRGRIFGELGALFAAEAAAAGDAALRGPLHRVLEGGGVVAGATEGEIDPGVRGRLKALGVRAGRLALFLPAALKPRAMGMRAALWALRAGVGTPGLPGAGLVSCRAPDEWPGGFGAAMGWVTAGPVLVRLDIAERVVAELAYMARRGRAVVPGDLASRLAVRVEELPSVLRGLGVRLAPPMVLEAGQFGPPGPLMVLPARRGRVVAGGRGVVEVAALRTDNPFAALARLWR